MVPIELTRDITGLQHRVLRVRWAGVVPSVGSVRRGSIDLAWEWDSAEENRRITDLLKRESACAVLRQPSFERRPHIWEEGGDLSVADQCDLPDMRRVRRCLKECRERSEVRHRLITGHVADDTQQQPTPRGLLVLPSGRGFRPSTQDWARHPSLREPRPQLLAVAQVRRFDPPNNPDSRRASQSSVNEAMYRFHPGLATGQRAWECAVSVTKYGIEKESLRDLLGEARDGQSQLPDFQRGWIWDDERVRSLLASISLGFPIGAVMMLETGGQSVRFKQRSLEGAPPSPKREADRLVLDGQQRLTSLFQSLFLDQPVETRDQRGKPIKRWYYVDMQLAIDPDADREDAIVSLPPDRQIKKFGRDSVEDYSTPDREYEEMLFPLSKVFHSSSWRRGFQKYWKHAEDKMDLWDEFEENFVDRFRAVPSACHRAWQGYAQGGCLPGLREGQHRRRNAHCVRIADRHLRRRRL